MAFMYDVDDRNRMRWGEVEVPRRDSFAQCDEYSIICLADSKEQNTILFKALGDGKRGIQTSGKDRNI